MQDLLYSYNEYEGVVEETKQSLGVLDIFKRGLSKTRASLSWIRHIGKNVDYNVIEELEEAMILSDIGIETTEHIVKRLTQTMKNKGLSDAHDLKRHLMDELISILKKPQLNKRHCDYTRTKPYIILFIGVNGSGKTTTIGKLAYNLTKNSKKVLIAAGDTFRAAAIEQLEEWGIRSGANVIRHNMGKDPAAVVFDSLKAAVSRNCDVLLIDTAGRLHNRNDLMEELIKIRKVISREVQDAPHETLLILDATTGQNGVVQAKVFLEAVNVTGIVLTKLDSTSKGGIVINISETLGIPVRFIGIGEKIDDLRRFDPSIFVSAIFED